VIDADAFAALLCDWCLEASGGQQVLVASTTLAEPLVAAVYRALLDREAWPLVRVSPPRLQREFYAHATDRQLDGFAPAELSEAEEVDASLRIEAPADLRDLADVDPDRLARAARARRPLQRARLARRWAVTLWPTPALYEEAGMGADEYESFLTRALFLDRSDPAEAWRDLAARQQALAERLAEAREVRIEAEGTDLRLGVAGRRWINSDGRRNMPSGEVFTGPHEDSAEGTIRFTIPSNLRGVHVEGVELTFRGGEVIAARAGSGDDHLQSALATDGGAKRLGELGIGTNGGIDRATGSTLLDEKIAGTIHLALGRSYPETGGGNESALHWDLVCDLRTGGRLTVDGEELDLRRFIHTRSVQ
jgi:aminopeptidase